jgi:hydroxypyruvate isomerase
MPRFTANLSLLFTEVPLLERFALAKQYGFTAVEIQFPYLFSAEQIQAALLANDLRLVLFNVDADTLLQGGEGLAAVPEKQAQFKEAVAQAADYAAILKPEVINVLPGRCLDLARLPEYQATLLENLHYASQVFAEQGITTVFEAVNSIDMPGFIIDNSEKMLATLAAVNHPNLRLQYDIYHLTRMGEDCAAFFKQHLAKIGHIQFADCPGRNEPGTGVIDFVSLFALLDANHYSGWVGAEYRPSTTTAESLAWMKSLAV